MTTVQTLTDLVEVTAQRDLLAKKLTNCVHALTFAIDGWDETDPYITKLRATRDNAKAALEEVEGAS